MWKPRRIPLNMFQCCFILSTVLQTAVETFRVEVRVLINEDHVTVSRVCRNQSCPIHKVGASQNRKDRVRVGVEFDLKAATRKRLPGKYEERIDLGHDSSSSLRP